MEIKKLFQRDAVQTAQTARQRQLAEYQQNEQAAEQQARGTGDRVSLSTLSRRLSVVPDVLRDDEAERAERVNAIKEQVANGTYNVDSEAVARTLILYALDNKDLS